MPKSLIDGETSDELPLERVPREKREATYHRKVEERRKLLEVELAKTFRSFFMRVTCELAQLQVLSRDRMGIPDGVKHVDGYRLTLYTAPSDFFSIGVVVFAPYATIVQLVDLKRGERAG
jgi:hypothetical protein